MKISKDLLRRIGIALVIIIVTIAVILGAWRPSKRKPSAPQPEIQTDVPVAVYENAEKRLKQQQDISYTVAGVKQTIVGKTVLEETFSQTVTYEDLNTDHLQGYVEEKIVIGTHEIQSHEYFSDDVAYFTTQNVSFQAPMTAAEYVSRYIPATTIEKALYTTVSGQKVGDVSIFSFESPTAVEKWLFADECTLVSASATATVDANGNLTGNTYNVEYTKDSVSHKLQLTVTIAASEIQPVQLPDSSKVKSISNINAPKMLEKSCGYLTTLNNITSVYDDTIICEVFGDKHMSTVKISTGNASKWTANIESTSAHDDISKPGDTKVTQTFERFKDGVYSYSSDGQNYTTETSIDLAAMQERCRGYLIGSIIMPEQIVSVTVTETENTYQLQLHPNEDFASMIAENACYALYKDATILTGQAQSHTTNTLSCYMHIDKETGFPVAYGYSYTGNYILGDLPNLLSFDVKQTFATPDIPTKP